MSSIDSEDLVYKILKNNGKYEEDIQVLAVYKYNPIFNLKSKTYKLIYPSKYVSFDKQIEEFNNSEYCLNRECLFERPEELEENLTKNWLTDSGKEFIKVYEQSK